MIFIIPAFRYWLREELAAGRIPTPTHCRDFLVSLGARTGSNLNGSYSGPRIEEFERAGLVQDRPGARWRWPS